MYNQAHFPESHNNHTRVNHTIVAQSTHLPKNLLAVAQGDSSGGGPSNFPRYYFVDYDLSERDLEVINSIASGLLASELVSSIEEAIESILVESYYFYQGRYQDGLSQLRQSSELEVLKTSEPSDSSSSTASPTAQITKDINNLLEFPPELLLPIIQKLSGEDIISLMQTNKVGQEIIRDILLKYFDCLSLETQLTLLGLLPGPKLIELIKTNGSIQRSIKILLNQDTEDLNLRKAIAEEILAISPEFLHQYYKQAILRSIFYSHEKDLDTCFDEKSILQFEYYGLMFSMPNVCISARVKAFLSACSKELRDLNLFYPKYKKYWSEKFISIRETFFSLTFSDLTPEQQAFFTNSDVSIWNLNTLQFRNLLQCCLSLKLVETLPSTVFDKVLLIAISLNHLGAVNILINRPEFKNHLEISGDSFAIEAIRTALLEGNFRIVRHMLEYLQNCDKEASVLSAWSTTYDLDLGIWINFLTSIQQGELEKVQRALQEINALQDNKGRTALLNASLYLAAKYGYIEVIKTLSSAGANPKYKGNFSHTPRDIASAYGHIKTLPAIPK